MLELLRLAPPIRVRVRVGVRLQVRVRFRFRFRVRVSVRVRLNSSILHLNSGRSLKANRKLISNAFR